MKSIALFIVTYFLFITIAEAQTLNIEPVDGLPTKEIYNMLVDSKGFIWVAHDFGVSRYDGISFTNFYNPSQTSLGMTDLAEDKQGRIWCHNFTGQIFYIENERMHLLESYDPRKELFFPRILVCGDELIATSSRGLFVCTTSNFKCRYLKCNDAAGKAEGTKSISKINNTIIAYSDNNWYRYQQKTGVRNLEFNDDHNLTIDQEFVSLQRFADKDTIFLLGSPSAMLYKLVIKDESVNLVNKERMNGRINDVIYCNNEYWVNTKNESYTTDKKCRINDYNLSDIIIDNEGNTWYSSLTRGLLVKFKPQEYQIINSKGLEAGDFIRCIYKEKNLTIYGTQKGEIILEDSAMKKIIKRFDLSKYIGDIDDIYPFSENKFLIRPSIGLYMLDVKAGKFRNIASSNIIKDVAINKDAIFLATIKGVRVLPLIYSNATAKDWFGKIEKGFGILQTVSATKSIYLNKNSRCQAICFDSTTRTLFAAFADGLYKINSSGLHPLLNNNLPVYASSLAFSNNKLFVSTFNNKLLIFKRDAVKQINIDEGITPSTVLGMKIVNDHLWLLGEGIVQILNIKNESFIKDIPFPQWTGYDILNVAEENGVAYFTTLSGVFKVDMNKKSIPVIKPFYLLYGLINNNDTIIANDATLKYNENDIKFFLSSPSFSNPQRIYFQYRLVGSNNTSWSLSSPGQRSIHYASLSPGKYVFEALATNSFGITAKKAISFAFQVSKPLWQQWWFYTLIALVTGFIIFYIIRQRIVGIRQRNKLTVEKLKHEKELSISILTAIKSQLNPHFIFNTLNTIQSFIFTNEKQIANDYLGKLSDLMRRILDYSDRTYITLAHEIGMLQLYIDLELLRYDNNFISSINVSPLLNADTVYLPPMLLQPYVENAIAHGLIHKENDKELKIIFREADDKGFLQILIEDNGVGRERSVKMEGYMKNNHESFANKANENRINLINKSLTQKIKLNIIDKKNMDGISSGTIVQILLPYEEMGKLFYE